MSFFRKFDDLRISLDEIKSGTSNFCRTNYIGGGGFGKVYKGELVLSGRPVMVAVKRLDPRYGQGNTEFWQEINVLTHYKHENIVSLLGFCDEAKEKILVYEYLPNESLAKHLSSLNLSWIDRLNICIGVSRGLEHLHCSPGQILLHRDIKSSNILLDTNWDAKISDFGLSRTITDSKEFSFHMSDAAGTPGYFDQQNSGPEFMMKEVDVYSFGVVLFEVLCGRLCNERYKQDGSLLSEQAQSYYEEKTIRKIVLDCLQDQISPSSLAKFSAIAYRCLQRDHSKRPSISEIKRELRLALACQVQHDFWKEGRLSCHTLSPLIKNTRMYNRRFVRLPK